MSSDSCSEQTRVGLSKDVSEYVIDIKYYFDKELLFELVPKNKDEEQEDTETIATELIDATSRADSYYTQEKSTTCFSRIIKLFDPYKSLYYLIARDFNAQNVTNNWTKMWEILSTFDMIPRNIKNESYVTFDTSDNLGNSFHPLHHYIKTNTSIKSHVWTVNAPEYSADIFEFEKNYESRSLRCSLRQAAQYFSEQKLEKVNLFVANRGVETYDYNKLESTHYPQLAQEVELCSLCLTKGGSAMFKIYTMFSTETRSLLSSLYYMFEKVFIYKPSTCKISSSESYIVALKYKGEKVPQEFSLSIDMTFSPTLQLGKLQVSSVSKAVELYDKIESSSIGVNDEFWRAMKTAYNIQSNEIQREWFKKFPVKALKTKDRLKIKEQTLGCFK